MEKQKFKQTEIGEIPEDWDTKSIEELSNTGGLIRGPFGGSLKKDCFVSAGYKVYEQRNAIYCDANIGRYYINDIKFLELKRFEVKENDLIISCSGTIGKIFQIPKMHKKGIINQALLKISINKSACLDKYFIHYFGWDDFQKKIIDSTQGGAMKNLIGMAEFKKTLIAIPSNLQEQTAIATVLSDTDELITSLDKLIAKKKAIKQGAMQELLTGKKRLPGFEKQKGFKETELGEIPEDWEVKEFGEVLKIKHGKSQNGVIQHNGDYPILATGGEIGRTTHGSIINLLC
ncbi:MAG: restriction endonuclease subunit S [Vampirovibrionia bacterium]